MNKSPHSREVVTSTNLEALIREQLTIFFEFNLDPELRDWLRMTQAEIVERLDTARFLALGAMQGDKPFDQWMGEVTGLWLAELIAQIMLLTCSPSGAMQALRESGYDPCILDDGLRLYRSWLKDGQSVLTPPRDWQKRFTL
jgi:hypothetical protein